MSREDKIARNIVTLTFMLVFLMLSLLLMSSCSTTSYSCPAYASIEKTK